MINERKNRRNGGTLIKKKKAQSLANTVSFSCYKTSDLENNMRSRSKVGMKFCTYSTLVIRIINMMGNKHYPFLWE